MLPLTEDPEDPQRPPGYAESHWVPPGGIPSRSEVHKPHPRQLCEVFSAGVCSGVVLFMTVCVFLHPDEVLYHARRPNPFMRKSVASVDFPLANPTLTKVQRVGDGNEGNGGEDDKYGKRGTGDDSVDSGNDKSAKHGSSHSNIASNASNNNSDGSHGDRTTVAADTKQPMYHASDWERFVKWKKYVPFEGQSLPRVLIYTWCTENTFHIFQNENYWKCCYAHLHGFDVVFSDKKNFSGVAQYPRSEGEWYSEENMWAWWSDLQPYLFSGKYDYVFLMGADVLIQGYWFEWPVWAWDRGHDITVMDQDTFPYGWRYGLNENNVLWRPTNFSKQFINEGFSFRHRFHLQGDNGPYMETILRNLGRSAEKEGREGYDNRCYTWLTYDKPSGVAFGEYQWVYQNDQYDLCFFSELTRLAGAYGYRNATGIGFYPTYVGFTDIAVLPDASRKGAWVPPEHPHHPLLPLGPWANCWSSPRKFWDTPWLNCFAYHFNGPKDEKKHATVSGGTCPDPTFNWDASPYNPANRGHHV